MQISQGDGDCARWGRISVCEACVDERQLEYVSNKSGTDGVQCCNKVVCVIKSCKF